MICCNIKHLYRDIEPYELIEIIPLTFETGIWVLNNVFNGVRINLERLEHHKQELILAVKLTL
jgi:hypothetical protein